MISFLELEKAYQRIRPYALQTPFIYSKFLSERWNAEVFLKCEQLQPVGAFKIRGAANFALQISEGDRKSGFVTHSSGNHAQAVSYMAHKLGTKAYIVMPSNSNQVKMQNARKWGAEIHLCEPTIQARLQMAEEIQSRTGATMIPPFDHEYIIQGQATAAMEMLREEPDLELITVTIGGGGICAGTALATKYFGKDVSVIGTEPEQACDAFEGFNKKERVTEFTPNTIADGLRTTVGEIPFDIILNEVRDIWLASEEAIVRWMYAIWREEKMVVEPSSAVVIAAMDERKNQLSGKKMGVILTAGNVDFRNLPPVPKE